MRLIGLMLVTFFYATVVADEGTTCNVKGKVFDKCELHCDCIDGRMTNCYRIRKEFTQMTNKERKRYINTYLTLTTKLPYKYKYEKFIYIHFKYFCYGIHNKDLFFPWHRFYILQMENLLREIDCRVTLPYWDWSVAADNPWDRTGIWTNKSYGLGGNGVESKGFCVQDGEFRQGQWHTPFFNDNLDIVTSTIDINGDLEEKFVTPDLSDCLRRYFDGYLPNELHVRRALSLPAERFSDFDLNLRVNYHDTIHNSIDGTMGTHYAGTAPEFFLHHAFLDKIWFMWQKRSSEHKFVKFGNSRKKLMGFLHEARDLIDSHNLPGSVKVTYSKFPDSPKFKRSVGSEAAYVDDVNNPESSVFDGILETEDKRTFPSCKRSQKEKKRAKYLDKIFSRGID